jgi:hypothetical protein
MTDETTLAFVDAFTEAMPWRLMPAYVGLAVLTGWVGLLSTTPVQLSPTPTVRTAIKVLMLAFAATPLLYAAGDAYRAIEDGDGS